MLKNKQYNIFFILSITCFLFIEQNSIRSAFINVVFGNSLLIYLIYKEKIKFKFESFKNKYLVCVGLILTLFYILEVGMNFYENLNSRKGLNKVIEILFNTNKEIMMIIIIILCIISMYGIFILWINFLYFIVPILITFCKNLKKYEKIYFITFFLFFFSLIFYSFIKTNIFYLPTNDKACYFDIIFTADTGYQYFTNVFLNILAWENDIRQPLFGLFALPISILAYILSYVFFFLEDSYALFLTILNIILIGITNILISRMLPLKKEKEKLIFLIFYSSLYPTVLFIFILEQYVIAVFYLILFIYVFINKYIHDEVIFIGMVGTLITSCILGINYFNLKNKKDSFIKIKKIIFIFISSIILVGYFNILLNSIYRIIYFYKTFGGEKILFSEKIRQYFSFILNCFIAPSIVQIQNILGDISIKLNEIEKINTIGIIIFIACLVSFFFYKKNKFIQNCFIWILFSWILLGLIGWGTKENGLILYSHYFSWAFSSLIFLFLRKIIKKNSIFYSIMIVTSTYLLYINLNGIIEIINFGVKYYPKSVIL